MAIRSAAVDAVEHVAAWMRPCVAGRRWILSALMVGIVPFLIAWRTGWQGHHWLSAVLLAALCLPLADGERLRAGLGLIGLAFLSHCIVVIAASNMDAIHVAPLLPGADDYWRKQVRWIATGWDPEYELNAWSVAHVQLMLACAFYTATSAGALTFLEGFREVDLMNYYTGQLAHYSGQWQAAVAGWHVWSMMRGFGFLFLTFGLIVATLRSLRRGGLRLPWRLVAAGVGFLVLDGVTKAMLLRPVREVLFGYLGPVLDTIR